MAAPSLVEVSRVRQFVDEVCGAVGMPASDAELFRYALVEADLRGVSSHGCARLPAYARALKSSVVNPAPHWRQLHGAAAVGVFDGDNGHGLVLGQRAMTHAVDLAGKFGIGAVAVRNSNHTGMIAAHLTPAISSAMIGYFTSNGPAIMAPFGGRDARLGNGPFAYGIPTSSPQAIILDMAASASNRGRIRQFAQAGYPIPEGWALDEHGGATTDPSAALRGVLLPASGHKGYGLAFVNEVLSAVLTGAALAMNMPREFLQEGSRVLDSWRSGHFAIAINISAFRNVNMFLRDMDELCRVVRSSQLAQGAQEVLLPGAPEWHTRQQRSSVGIPFDEKTVASLRELAAELGVEPLWA
jgi:LDH2 family malate/lactate/ureidoglycolate dehydrogenase